MPQVVTILLVVVMDLILLVQLWQSYSQLSVLGLEVEIFYLLNGSWSEAVKASAE